MMKGHESEDEDLIRGYTLVERIDKEVPDGVYVLHLGNMIEKADFIFEEGAELFGFNGTHGYARWNLETSGTYRIFCQMTACEARPLKLSIRTSDNGQWNLIPAVEIASGVTGSWTSDSIEWFHYGPLTLDGNSIQFHSESYWPHVKRFVLVPTNASPMKTPDALFTTDREPQLCQLSHAGIAEKIASIPERQEYGKANPVFVTVLRKPKDMSDNVSVEGSMITVDGTSGFYEFEFINECWAEDVFLDITYSSGDSRPINVAINGDQSIDENLCSAATGGYGAGDFINVRCGPYPIRSEVNTIRITGTGYFPHVIEIRVVDVRTNSDTVTDISSGTWIVPPSHPMRSDLVDSLKSFCFVETTQEPNPDFEPDPTFYNGINCDGLWVLASKEVDERVLKCAAELMCRYIPIELRRLCLQWRAPLDMPQGPFRLIILDPKTNQQAGDCPEFPDHLPGRNGTSNPGIFTSAEDFSDAPGQGSCGDLTVHEVTHGLDLVIRQQLDPYFFQELDDCYNAAMETLVYQKAYAAANRHEYLAEICTLFVGTNPHNFERGCCQCDETDNGTCDWEPHRKFPPGKCGVPFRRKSDLIANDPRGYELLKSFLIEIKDPDDDSFWWQ
jgi:hypothetical protein